MEFRSAATLIGSFPHDDHGKVLDLVLSHIKEVPVWAQLPRNPREGMVPQFARGLPGLTEKAGKLFVDTEAEGFDAALVEFFEDYLSAKEEIGGLGSSRFAFSPEEGEGFSRFLDALEGGEHLALKGQITGPFTLATSLVDQDEKMVLYHDELKDACVKHLAMNARFQVESLKPFCENVLIFMDEPALAGFGTSAFISVSKDEVAGMLTEAAREIRYAGGLAGVHVCANTDWGLVLELPIDVVNFDAYAYFDRFALYKGDILAFLERGGNIAWGIVPTFEAEDIEKETPESLAERLSSQVGDLFEGEMDLKQVFAQSLITPSCGCGSLTVPLAEKVVKVTADLSRLIKESQL